VLCKSTSECIWGPSTKVYEVGCFSALCCTSITDLSVHGLQMSETGDKDNVADLGKVKFSIRSVHTCTCLKC